MSYAALARYYDAFTQNMGYEQRIDFLCALLAGCGLAPGATILDLACGTGTYSYALLRRGYDVVGVDASADMLSIAREKCPGMLLLCQRLEQLDLYGTAQAAICLTDSLNHITNPKDLRRFFKRLALFLEPGAPFVFDVNTLHKHEHSLGGNTFVYESAGAFCVWQNRWLPEQRTTEITLDLFVEEDGAYTRHQEQFCERVYSVEELSAWLNKAGFEVEQTLDAPGEAGERLYFVARRKSENICYTL